MKFKFFFLISFFLFVTACSKDDNPTDSNNNDTFISGSWSAYAHTTQGTKIDSIKIDVNLTGSNGTFSGTGEIYQGGRDLGSSYTGIFKDEIKGTYSANTSIALTAKNNVTGDTFNFAGNYQSGAFDSNAFEGVATSVINGTTYTYSCRLFKNDN